MNKKNMEKFDSKDLRTQFINQFSGSLFVSESDEVDPKSIWEKEVED